MNYAALIQNRKSSREFTDRQVAYADLENLKTYHQKQVRRLIPAIKTELYFFSTSARAALEGAAGYNRFLVGAPQYMVLLSEKHPHSHLNAGYMMEDLILKATDLNLDTCWLTFAASEEVKESLGIESDLDVVAMAAFGYGAKVLKRLRLNIRSMSNVDVVAKHKYMEPKLRVQDMTYVDSWVNSHNLCQLIGFYDDVLWEALYASTLAPSYLNRQAYGFLLHQGKVTLVSRPDDYNTKVDQDLSLGAVLLHFSAVAENWVGKVYWNFDGKAPELPKGHSAVATWVM